MFKSLTSVAAFIALVSAIPLPRLGSLEFPFLSRYAGRIINGTDTTIEENPYQISLQLKYYGHWCGGVIISKNWVLTAAHCVMNTDARFMILAGTANQFEGGTLHGISETIVHEDFGNGARRVNDIALMRIDEPFAFDGTRDSIPLYAKGEETKVGSMGKVTGWGETSHGYPDILNRVEVPVISKVKCNALYGDIGGIGHGQICTGYEEGGKDACQGDSGGPLTVGGRLAGIVSWGRGCAVPKNPGVHTEIAYFRDWIEKHSGV